MSGVSLWDFTVFPDLEGAFPDLDNHFQMPKIALDQRALVTQIP